MALTTQNSSGMIILEALFLLRDIIAGEEKQNDSLSLKVFHKGTQDQIFLPLTLLQGLLLSTIAASLSPQYNTE